MTAELASPGRLLHIPQTFFDTNLNHLTSTYVYLAVPHTCRQKTLPATALSKVMHAFHACKTICRRSSGNASGSKAVRLSSVPPWAISEAVMSRLRLAHLAVQTVGPLFANISACVKSAVGLPRHANLSTVLSGGWCSIRRFFFSFFFFSVSPSSSPIFTLVGAVGLLRYNCNTVIPSMPCALS